MGPFYFLLKFPLRFLASAINNSQILKFVKKGSGRNLDIKAGLFCGLNVQGQLPP